MHKIRGLLYESIINYKFIMEARRGGRGRESAMTIAHTDMIIQFFCNWAWCVQKNFWHSKQLKTWTRTSSANSPEKHKVLQYISMALLKTLLFSPSESCLSSVLFFKIKFRFLLKNVNQKTRLGTKPQKNVTTKRLTL